MARYDSKSEIKQSVALNFQAISSDTTTDGNWIDMQGYNSLVFILACVARSAGDITCLIQDADASDKSDVANVTDTFLSGLESDTKVDVAQETSRIGYVGKKRYVRLSGVSANSANLTAGAIAIQSKGDVPQA